MSEPDIRQLQYRSITLQPDHYRCLIAEERVELTPVEFRLLQTLISQPGSSEDLIHSIYGVGYKLE